MSAKKDSYKKSYGFLEKYLNNAARPGYEWERSKYG